MSDSHSSQVLKLFVRHQPRIKGFILALLPDYTAADDVLQETFLVVQRKAADFDPNSNFLSWAFQIARFQVMKSKTAFARHSERFSELTLDSLTASAPVEPQEDERRHLLPLCLDKLAPQARRIVDLFYRDEHPPREIARLLSWSPAAVSVTLSRARKLLRDCLQRQLDHAASQPLQPTTP